MAKSVLDIVIKLSKQGGADQETVRGLVQLKTSILQTVAVAGSLVAAGYSINKVLNETVGVLVSYADQVRKTSDMTGLSAESSSRLIQVLDNLQISYDSLQKVVQKSGKTYDYSIDGLAKMSDQYMALGSAQEKAAFMQERFGKEWGQWVQVMEKGSAKLHEMNNAVDESLVLSQRNLQETRLYEMMLDDLNDKITAIKITVGEGILGLITGSTVDIRRRTQEIFKLTNGYELNTNQMGRWSDAQKRAWQEAEKQAEAEWMAARGIDAAGNAAADAALDEQALQKAAEARSKQLQDALGLIVNVSQANADYAKSQSDLTAKMADVQAQADALIKQGWDPMSEKVQDLRKQYSDLATQYNDNANAHRQASNRIIYDLLVQKMAADGMTDAEFQIAMQAGVNLGIIDRASAQMVIDYDKVTNAVIEHKARLEDIQGILNLMTSRGYTVDVAIKMIQSVVDSSTWIDTQMNKASQTRGGNAYVSPAQSYSGGARDSGGPGVAGGVYLIGRGAQPEAFIAPADGMFVPNADRLLGGGTVNVYLTVSSPVTILDRQNAQNVLLPFIIQGVRDAKARGAI